MITSPPRRPPVPPSSQYDPDAFDSLMVVNAEEWNEGQADEGGLTRDDLLPQVNPTHRSFTLLRLSLALPGLPRA